MRGLKVQNEWIQKILSGEKTMEVRIGRYKVLGQRIALGNSGNGLVEGYATVQEILEIPLAEVSKYQRHHLATDWLLARYGDRETLYGYCLMDVKREKTPFNYTKSGSIWFALK
ncbi:MAG: ASCH domain-containing protein [Candidatus Bathyarchaeia archaeon]|jgi:hypothetical protein